MLKNHERYKVCTNHITQSKMILETHAGHAGCPIKVCSMLHGHSMQVESSDQCFNGVGPQEFHGSRHPCRSGGLLGRWCEVHLKLNLWQCSTHLLYDGVKAPLVLPDDILKGGTLNGQKLGEKWRQDGLRQLIQWKGRRPQSVAELGGVTKSSKVLSACNRLLCSNSCTWDTHFSQMSIG